MLVWNIFPVAIATHIVIVATAKVTKIQRSLSEM